MPEPIRIRVFPPTGPLPPGRGFYQLEEDALYFQVGGFSKPLPFFSYLESETVRFDIDRRGRIIFVEVSLPRRQWQVDSDFRIPNAVEQARILFLDFRQWISQPRIMTDLTRENLRLEFETNGDAHTFQVSANLYMAVNNSGHLASVTITAISDDLAGQELTSFRRRNVAIV